MNGQPQRRTILSEDGELRDVEAAPAAEDTAYCIHCGTSNRSIARFCRNCGQELDDEPQTYRVSGAKTKRDMVHQSAAPSSGPSVLMMIYNLLKITVVGFVAMIMVTTNHSENFFQYMMAAFFILMWVAVEAIQAYSPRR